MAPQSADAIEIFYSYSHRDEELRDQLKNHLSMLKRQGVIKAWHYRRISAGQEWDRQIDAHLNSAHIILLLVSSDFLASNYCYDIEVERAMARHEVGEARVIPIILRPCDWQSAPFAKLTALPKDAKAVTKWDNTDEAFLDIAKGIRNAAAEMSSGPISGTDQSVVPPQPTRSVDIPNILRVDFVGRSDNEGNDLTDRLKDELAPHKRRLVALWGAGGVGKTALAAEVARALSDEFAQRVVWVTADGDKDFSISSLLDEIAKQLKYEDLRELALEPKKEQVRGVLAATPTLVVLDNFETITPEEGRLCAEWLAQPALCSALITTREIVEAAARNIALRPMLSEEARTLLRRLISEVHEPAAFQSLDYDRVIETADANPLVLQWIVRQIDLAQSPEEVLDELRHGEGLAAERVFDRSFNLKQMDNGGRAALLALSLFVRGTAERRALAHVAGLGKYKDRLFKDAVKTLSSLWLIRATDASKRLAVGGLTRDMTAARLRTGPYAPDIWRRFTDYFNDPRLRDKESSNVLRAIQTAACAHDWDSVVELYDAPDEFMHDAFKSWKDAIRLAEEYAEQQIQIEGGSRPLLIEIQHMEKGDAQKHYAGIEAKLGREEKPWRTAVRCAVKFELGVFACDCGDYPLARELMQEAQTLQKEIKHDFGVGMTCNNLGVVIAKHRQAGWKVEAMSKFQQAHKYFTDRAEEDSAQVRDRYAQSLCNIAGLGTEWKQGERFAKAVEMNMRWLDDLSEG